MRIILALLPAVGLIVGGLHSWPIVVAAQESTPVLGRDVPGPEECTIEPRPVEEDVTLAATPVSPAIPIVSDVPFGVPDGEAADAETVDAVTATAREFYACGNADDVRRIRALLTEEALRRFFIGGLSAETIRENAAATALPLPPEAQLTVFAVLDVEILSDGRAGAFVIVDDPADPLPVEVNYYLFAEEGGRWKVDDFLFFDEQGALLQ
jgi:hypothetical protein